MYVLLIKDLKVLEIIKFDLLQIYFERECLCLSFEYEEDDGQRKGINCEVFVLEDCELEVGNTLSLEQLEFIQDNDIKHTFLVEGG